MSGTDGRYLTSGMRVEYRKNKTSFHTVTPARVRPSPATLLPLMLRSARIPSAARPAGALARGDRDPPRSRAPLPRRANAQRLGDLAGCQQTPRGGAEEFDSNVKEVIVCTRGGTASMV